MPSVSKGSAWHEDGYEGLARSRPPDGQTNAVRGKSERIFSLFGSVYDQLTNHELWYRQNASLVDHLPHSGIQRVLDLGCGTGVGTLAIAERLPKGAKVVGMDITPDMVRRADAYRKAKGDASVDKVSFKAGDATETGFRDGSFSAITANSFLYLVPDPEGVLSEAHRILAPGGRLVFMEPHANGSWWNAAAKGFGAPEGWGRHLGSSIRLVAAMSAWRVASGMAGRRQVSEQLGMLERAGFVNVRAEPTLGGLGVHIMGERAKAD